jgi:hypothetical protein
MNDNTKTNDNISHNNYFVNSKKLFRNNSQPFRMTLTDHGLSLID